MGKLNDFTILLSSHSSTIDVLVPAISRIEKYFPGTTISIAIDNIECLNAHIFKKENIQLIQYDNSLIFFDRIKYILHQINSQFVLLLIDKLIITDTVNQDCFRSLIEQMKLKDISQIMFTACSNNKGNKICSIDENNSIFLNEGPYFFSLHPTLWKRNVLLDIVSKYSSCNYKCSECNLIQTYVSKTFINCIVSSELLDDIPNEDYMVSKIFPYVNATADKRWYNRMNNSTIKIQNILDEYNIDPTIRGWWITQTPSEAQCALPPVPEPTTSLHTESSSSQSPSVPHTLHSGRYSLSDSLRRVSRTSYTRPS